MLDLELDPAEDALAAGSEESRVIVGLMAEPPWVSPKYLYGPLGSRLYWTARVLTGTPTTSIAAPRWRHEL